MGISAGSLLVGKLWLGSALLLSGIFMGLIMIRITVPRLKLETMSRLGWLTLLGVLGAVACVYLTGLLLA